MRIGFSGPRTGPIRPYAEKDYESSSTRAAGSGQSRASVIW